MSSRAMDHWSSSWETVLRRMCCSSALRMGIDAAMIVIAPSAVPNISRFTLLTARILVSSMLVLSGTRK